MTSFVVPKPKGEAPTLLTELKPKEITEGETVKLVCKVKGKPEPEIEWFKDDEPVETDQRIKVDYGEQESTLTIKDAVLDDEADYKCVVTNDLGSVSTTAEVLVNKKEEEEPVKPAPKVKEELVKEVIEPNEEQPVKSVPKEEEKLTKPVIKSKIEDKETDVGTTAKFTVEVEGSPVPEVDWYKDDKVIEGKGRFIIVDDETDKGVSSSLVIEDVKPEDSGVYNAVAFNDEGEITTEATLKVADTPESIVEPEIAPVADQEVEGT